MRVLWPLAALVSACTAFVTGQRQSVISVADNVCRTKECSMASTNMLRAMNPRVDPCENFYEYACGGFFQNTKIPPTKSMLNNGFLQENIDSTIHKILESDPGGPNSTLSGAASRILQKAQGFYKSCMNETRITETGQAQLLTELRHLVTSVFPVRNSPLISHFPDATPSAGLLDSTKRERLTSAIAYLYRSSALTILSFLVNSDERNPSIQQLWILRDAPAIPDRVFLEKASILAKYRKAIEEVYTLVFGKSEGSSEFATDVIALETKIANISSNAATDTPQPSKSQHVSPMDLNEMYPSLNWPVFLETILQGTNVTFDDNRDLYILLPSHLKGLDRLLQETPASTLQTYFAWMTISSRHSLLPHRFREPLDHIARILEGIVDPDMTPDRWQTCVDSTSNNLAPVIGHFYITQRFLATTKDQVQGIVEAIRDAYHSDFQELDWLDNVTRTNAITKLNAMIELIGYSTVDPNLGSAEDLDQRYAAVEITEGNTYYENMRQANAYTTTAMLKQLGKPSNRDRMLMEPQYVNAYYNPLTNHFAVLAGIVQPPMFTPNAPEYLNFGGLGMVAGHEIGHGFDNAGRLYDATGKLQDWWTNTTAAEFKARTKCFIDQYANFTVTGPDGEILHTNGEQTLGENIADNGGVKTSFMAWAKRFASDRQSTKYNNKLLPGRRLAHLSREQLFFISLGQAWCRLRTPTFLMNQVRDDEHSPSHARVNGALQNSREFAKAFKCRRNSFMNPANKCEIW